jgi:uncharacterized membrane-anchored protein YhcB (DUF1043 family)
MSKGEGLPFALIKWIKKQQEEIESHRAAMVKKNAEDDKQFVQFMANVAMQWVELKQYEQALITNFVQWKEEGRNFTPQQKSAISGMYLRRVLNK